MTSEQVIGSAEDHGIVAAEPFSDAWWHERSTEELRAFMNRGIGAGGAFEGATAETERRARESSREVERSAEAGVTRNRRLRRVMLEALLLTSLFVVLAVELWR